MQVDLGNLHMVLGLSQLALLAGLLWKVSRLVQKVDLMWGVFAREHGLESGKPVRRIR